ncbi:MAG: multicopper oxidase domain-containing protein [Candidatus Acidiferrales bacterium]
MGATVRLLGLMVCAAMMGTCSGAPAQGQSAIQDATKEACPRPALESAASAPPEVRSRGGVLRVELAFRSDTDSNGQQRFCYIAADGSEAPTLRANPGDTVILLLRNEVQAASAKADPAAMPARMMMDHSRAAETAGDRSKADAACAGGAAMTVQYTNIHFHGLTIPPVCHQDDVLNTSIAPDSPAFEYRFRIPEDEEPGLYWYHPHVHGFSRFQVAGGASGALIVEGIARRDTDLADLPERILIVRDQALVNPNAPPSKNGIAEPPVVLDRDGDILNTGTGSGKPARDLSLNFVTVPYPDYPPAMIKMRPSQKEFWRVLNASSLSYLNLEVQFGTAAQPLGVVALDGAPLSAHGGGANQIVWMSHLGVPPGGRVEFVVKGPPAGVAASLVTRSVNTGPAGENDPNRPLARIETAADATEPAPAPSSAPSAPVATALGSPLTARADVEAHSARPWLGDVQPVRTRRLYFSETPQNPKDPNSPTTFFITVEGQTPRAFDPRSGIPNIVTHQGDVEDWIIENRTNEVHAFHIHQSHFVLMEWFGIPVNEPYLRDTINVPFWDGQSKQYPSVRLRMDFRDPNSVGTFPYHCHLLEHEDGGMMGLIRVEPAAKDGQK